MNMLRLQPSTNSPSNDMMEKAKHVWSMLDELAASDPTAYKNYIEKTLKEGKDFMAPPTPYLAVRSVLHSNAKIKGLYLNIFTWHRLPAPEKTDEITKMYSLMPIEAIHDNEPCIIINIAIHPNVVKIISRTKLIQSTFDLVASQHNLLVDYNKYKVLDEKSVGNLEEIQRSFVKPMLKNKTVDGNVEDLVDNRFSPSLIEKLSSIATTESSSSSKTEQKQQQKLTKKSPMLIEELWSVPTFTEEINNNNTSLIIRVLLPECESVVDCDVTVLPREDVVQIECSKLQLRLKLDMKKRKKPNLPNCNSTFDIQRLTAKFVRKTQHLILNVPIVMQSIVNEQNK